MRWHVQFNTEKIYLFKFYVKLCIKQGNKGMPVHPHPWVSEDASLGNRAFPSPSVYYAVCFTGKIGYPGSRVALS